MRKLFVFSIFMCLFLIGASTAEATTNTSYKWSLEYANVKYDLLSKKFQLKVIDAMQTWDYVSHFRFVPYNFQQWNYLQDGPLGLTGYQGMILAYHSGNLLYSIQTIFNTSYNLGDANQDSTAYDFQSLALHELGHWLHLDDEYSDPTPVMYGFSTKGLVKRALRQDDKSSVRLMYPNWYVNITGNMTFTGTAESFTRWYGTQLATKA